MLKNMVESNRKNSFLGLKGLLEAPGSALWWLSRILINHLVVVEHMPCSGPCPEHWRCYDNLAPAFIAGKKTLKLCSCLYELVGLNNLGFLYRLNPYSSILKKLEAY